VFVEVQAKQSRSAGVPAGRTQGAVVQGPGGRGLYSSTFRLNLSQFRH
jgi:hypothetical protein